MKSIGEYIDVLQTSLNQESDDSLYRERYIYSWMLTVRSMLIAQELEKGNFKDGQGAQFVENIRLCPIPPDPCKPAPPFNILRSVDKLPGLVPMKSGFAITNVYGAYGETYDVYTLVELADKKNMRTFKKENLFIFNQDYLYCYYATHDQVIVSIEGYFYDVVEFESFCNSESCTPAQEMHFDLPSVLEDRFIQITRERLASKLSLPLDLSNNSRPDNEQRGARNSPSQVTS